MFGPPPPLKLAPRSPQKRGRSVERVALSEMPQGAPFGLSLGLRRLYNNNNNNNNRNNVTKRAKKGCGHLENDEVCEPRTRLEGETYGSEIFYIKKKESSDILKVRKIGTNDHTKRRIALEKHKYMKLKAKDPANFEKFCLPISDDKENKHPYSIDFEYVAGEPLHLYVHKHKELSVEKRIEIFKQCVECLRFLARNGFIHGDIKMDNFWWDSTKENVRILDFEFLTETPPLRTTLSGKRSIEGELKKVFKLIELKNEFNLKERIDSILPADKESLLERILSAEDSEAGMKMLVGIYNQILGSRGGARLRLTRKKRDSK